MQDAEFERAGQEAIGEAAQLKQLDTLVNEPKKGAFITDLNGAKHTLTVETFSTYKTKEVLKMLANTKSKVDIIGLIREIQILATPIPSQKVNPDGTLGEFTPEEQETITQAQAIKVDTAMQVLPKLAEFAPDLALDFSALAILSNKELRAAYDNDQIDDLRAEKRKWLEFDFDASVPLKLLVIYLPHIGINLIMQEVGKLDQVAATSLLQSK